MKKVNNETKEILADLRANFHSAGIRITPQRVAVYAVLVKNKTHPSADSIYKEVTKIFPNISFDTVNRTLATLAEIGAAFVVEGSGDVKRFDANLKSHQHFKCVKCKRIVDFFYQPFNNIDVPSEIGRRFKVLRRTVYFEGICDACLDN